MDITTEYYSALKKIRDDHLTEDNAFLHIPDIRLAQLVEDKTIELRTIVPPNREKWGPRGLSGYYITGPGTDAILQYEQAQAHQLNMERKERRAERRDLIRWIGTSVIALIAIAISVLALLQSVGIIAIQEWTIWK